MTRSPCLHPKIQSIGLGRKPALAFHFLRPSSRLLPLLLRVNSPVLSVAYRRPAMATASPAPVASPYTIPSHLPPLPPVPGTDPSRCALDAFRTAIAQRVAVALPPLTVEQAYQGVDYGKKGVDFTVALPRFRLPGKVDELAAKVISQVSLHIRATSATRIRAQDRIEAKEPDGRDALGCLVQLLQLAMRECKSASTSASVMHLSAAAMSWL